MSAPQVAAIGLLDQLEARATEVGTAMASAILDEVPAIRTVSRNDPAFRGRFEQFCTLHVRTFVASTRQGRVASPSELEFVAEVARRRADDAFPLSGLLDGLRVGHRVLNRWISLLGSGWNTPAAVVLWLTTRLIDYMNAAGSVLSDSYHARHQGRAGRSDRTRRELLEDVLEGRFTSRPEAGSLAIALGFEPDGSYCVAVLRTTAEGTRWTTAAANALTQAAFRQATFQLVIGRRDEVVGVFRASEASGVVSEAVQSAPRLRGGLSTTCRGVAEVPRGYWEAVRAVHFASDAEPSIDLRRLGPLRYLELSADGVARRLALDYAGPLGRDPAGPRSGALSETIVCYVECGLNAVVAAERLGVHVNTVHNRLERVAALRGQLHLGPAELLELAAAIRICRRGGG